MELLERERPAIPLFTGVAGHVRGIFERDAQALVAAAEVFQSSSRPLLYAAAAEDAGAELAYVDRGGDAVDPLNAAFDTYLQPKRSPMRAGSVARCADWVCNVAL